MEYTLNEKEPVVVLVLGKKLKPDGSPTNMLIKRVECGCNVWRHYFQGNPQTVMVFTGGIVQRGHGIQSEAHVMRKLAVKNGIDPKYIILEDKALTTVENMVKSLPIIKKTGIKQIAVVTSEFHINRAMVITRNVFGDEFTIESQGHNSELTEKELKDEVRVECDMMERYKVRFPDWKFPDV